MRQTGAGKCRQRSMAPLACASAGTANGASAVDLTLNPRVAALKPSKTMALTDLARSLREQGQDVIGLAAGEPDFDTPSEIVEAGIAALRSASSPRCCLHDFVPAVLLVVCLSESLAPLQHQC